MTNLSKPWLGVVTHTVMNLGGTKHCTKVLYYTNEPIIADGSSEVRKIVFAEAVRANPDVNPADLEVYAIPFALPN